MSKNALYKQLKQEKKRNLDIIEIRRDNMARSESVVITPPIGSLKDGT
jgi:hypothetical protein